MAGINRADPEIFKAFTKALLESKYKKVCIFISHISVDKTIAINIGEYIRVNADFDIYLDIYDTDLQQAVSRGDDRKITEFIEKGINECTHVLCLLSSTTKNSWWVPYEIGFAKKGSKQIASLALKDAGQLPSYLKIERVIPGTKSLNVYLENINASGYTKGLSEASRLALLPHTQQQHPLDTYLNWQE